MIRTKRFPYWFLIFLVAAYFCFFWQLDKSCFRMWDESRLAVNALEMIESGDLIVTKYEDKADNWNTKPPLLIWLQVAFIKVLGFEELPVRLPSALAAFGTTLLLIGFLKRFSGNSFSGYTASIVLMTMPGYILTHCARTGDYDSFLAFWITLAVLSFFQYIHAEKNDGSKWRTLFFIAVLLGYFTKSIAVFLPMPGLIIYSLLQGSFFRKILNKEFILSGILVLLPIVLYYYLRDSFSPGYIKYSLENELTGRFNQGLEAHTGWFWYYFEQLYYTRMITWVWIFPASLFLAFFNKVQILRKLAAFSFLVLICFILILSSAGTKIEWYLSPAYPLIGIVIGIGIHTILQLLTEKIDALNRQWIVAALVIAIFGLPYFQILKEIPVYENHVDKYSVEAFLKTIREKHSEFKTIRIVRGKTYDAPVLFYMKTMNKYHGFDIKYADPKAFHFMPGDTLMVYHPLFIKDMKKNFHVTEFVKYNQGYLLRLDSRKQPIAYWHNYVFLSP